MSDELGHENFFWENPTWGFSNSENSGGTEDKKGKKTLFPCSGTPTPIPTPTPLPSTPAVQKHSPCKVAKSDGGGTSGGGVEGKGGGESDHEVHIWTERERRKKMRNMFSNLHALLPHLPPKADKSTIVDEAVNYIRTLQQTLQKLQKQKLERIRGITIMNYDSSMATPTILPFNSRETYLADQVSSMNLAMETNPSNSLFPPSFPISFQTWSSPNFVLNVCGEDAQISICTPKKVGLLTTILCVLEKHKLEVTTLQISSDSYKSMFMIHAHAMGSANQFQEALPAIEIFKLAVTEMIFWISS